MTHKTPEPEAADSHCVEDVKTGIEAHKVAVDAELAAMRVVALALYNLSEEQIRRVLHWARIVYLEE